jgi:hypothetical protein
VSVRLDVTTKPPGARIVRLDTGATIGTTPFGRGVPGEAAPVRVTLLLEGYEPVERELQLDRAARLDVVLAHATPIESGPFAGVAGGSGEVSVDVNGTPQTWLAIGPHANPVLVPVTGPKVLVVHLRASASGARASGALRVRRDTGAFRDNAWDLVREDGVTQGGRPLTSEKVLHFQVPAGAHQYSFAVGSGPGLYVLMDSARDFDWALAGAP